jgi:hypothetical protein
MINQDKSTNPQGEICRVFISYSHDSAEHRQRVLALANQLRKDGIEAWIDQYFQDPDEGWIRWMRSHVKQATKVLLVFTEIYQRRFEGAEEDGKGLGATFEGAIVTQALYESAGRNAKFRPVVFSEADERFIPSELRQFNRYRADSLETYEALLRWLHGAPETVAPPLGKRPDLSPEPPSQLFSSKSSETTAKDPRSAIENSDPTGRSLSGTDHATSNRQPRHWIPWIAITITAGLTIWLITFFFTSSALFQNPSTRPQQVTASPRVAIATTTNAIPYSDADHIESKLLANLREVAPQIDFETPFDKTDLSQEGAFEKLYKGDLSTLHKSGVFSKIDYLLLCKIKADLQPNEIDASLKTCRLNFDYRIFDKNGQMFTNSFSMNGAESTNEGALDQAIERVIKTYWTQLLKDVLTDHK